MLESPRIRFTPMERVHMKAYLQWLNSPLLAALWEQEAPRPHTARSAEKWLEAIHQEMDRGWHHYTIHVKSDKAIAGIASLVDIHPRDHHGRIRVAISTPKQRKAGIEGEAATLLAHLAFTELNLNRVSMMTWSFTDEATIKLITEAGFTTEGCLREQLFWRGQYWDATLWGLLRTDWALDHEDRLPFGADGHAPLDTEERPTAKTSDENGIFFTTDLMMREDDDDDDF